MLITEPNNDYDNYGKIFSYDDDDDVGNIDDNDEMIQQTYK